MKKVLVAYFSVTGTTEAMAQYIAEGIRISGHQAFVKKISEINQPEDVAGYDAYIFGSPTHYSDIPDVMKTILTKARRADLEGKLGGSFGSYTHDGNAPARILDILQNNYNMEPFKLGAINFKENMFQELDRTTRQKSQFVAGEVVEEGTGEGRRACQDYGRVFGESLSD
jgi:flavodoxin